MTHSTNIECPSVASFPRAAVASLAQRPAPHPLPNNEHLIHYLIQYCEKLKVKIRGGQGVRPWV